MVVAFFFHKNEQCKELCWEQDTGVWKSIRGAIGIHWMYNVRAMRNNDDDDGSTI